MSRIDNQPTVYNRVLHTYTKGFCKNNLQKGSTGSVLKGMEYRPDLLAEYYLGDSTLSWALIMANNFINGIEDFTPGREIIIPIV